MKKAAVVSIILSLVLCLFISGCQGNLYRVHVDAEHVSECKMKSGYRCGEEVTIQLDTITEHYYKVFADGVEVPQDNEKTNMESTYFIFIMPDHDVELMIEDHDVDIPFAP